jgi:DnaK suppressor protein
MPARKPSVKPTKARKTVSARPAPKKAAGPAAKAAAAKSKTAAAKPTPGRTQARTAAAKTPPKAATRAKPAASPAVSVVTRPVQPPKRAPEAVALQGGSLLAGPRNVEPYVPRRGEEYMSKAQLEHFRQILSSWKQDLMQEVDRTMLHMKDEAANFPDPNDRATQESEFSLELRTRDRERKLIRKIDEALKRIEDGSYGYCLETGEPIGVKRLEARPVATLSVEAQERRERREKQFGDRDDWYR